MDQRAGTYEGIDDGIFPYETPFKKKITENETELMLAEYKVLEDLLEETRKCQTTYFWSSLTTAGILITLGVRMISKANEISNLWLPSLAAILVICPVWCIWFDKASSITRITAYLRVLEDMILGNKAFVYIGWENSYGLFRYFCMDWYYHPNNSDTENMKARMKCTLNYGLDGLAMCKDFRQPHQYNILNWLGFFVVSLLCFILLFFCMMLKILNSDFLFVIPFLLVSVILSFTFVFTARVLSEITNVGEKNVGNRSTYRRELVWRYILDAKMFDKNGVNYVSVRQKEAMSDLMKKPLYSVKDQGST